MLRRVEMKQREDAAARRIPRHTRDALFVDENTLRVNCGRAGRELLVTLEDLRDKRVIDCDECRTRCSHTPQTSIEYNGRDLVLGIAPPGGRPV